MYSDNDDDDDDDVYCSLSSRQYIMEQASHHGSSHLNSQHISPHSRTVLQFMHINRRQDLDRLDQLQAPLNSLITRPLLINGNKV